MPDTPEKPVGERESAGLLKVPDEPHLRQHRFLSDCDGVRRWTWEPVDKAWFARELKSAEEIAALTKAGVPTERDIERGLELADEIPSQPVDEQPRTWRMRQTSAPGVGWLVSGKMPERGEVVEVVEKSAYDALKAQLGQPRTWTDEDVERAAKALKDRTLITRCMGGDCCVEATDGEARDVACAVLNALTPSDSSYVRLQAERDEWKAKFEADGLEVVQVLERVEAERDEAIEALRIAASDAETLSSDASLCDSPEKLEALTTELLDLHGRLVAALESSGEHQA